MQPGFFFGIITSGGLIVYEVVQTVPGLPNPVALKQATWFIDPVHGSDGNDGLTSGTALQTLGQLGQRWGAGGVLNPTGGTCTVNVLSPPPSSDPLNFDIGLANGDTLLFVGTIQSETALPVTAVRSRNRATNTAWALTLTSAAAPFIGARIHDVTQSAPGAPAYFFGTKDEGSDVLRISEPVQFPGVTNDLSNANRVTPLSSDSYTVQSLCNFTPGAMTVSGSGSVVFQDFAFDGAFSLLGDTGMQLFFYGCVAPFGNFLQLGSSFLNNVVNCCLRGPILWVVGSFNLFQAGGIVAHGPPVAFVVDISCTIRADIDWACQGLQGGLTVLTGTRWLFGTVGVFDSVAGGPGNQNPNGDGVRITPGASGAVTFADTDVTNQLYGSGNAGHGLTIGSNANFSYDPSVNATPMSITGAGGDVAIAGSGTAYQPEISSGNVTAVGPSALGWSAVFTGGGPFSGKAFDPIHNSWILPFA